MVHHVHLPSTGEYNAVHGGVQHGVQHGSSCQQHFLAGEYTMHVYGRAYTYTWQGNTQCSACVCERVQNDLGPGRARLGEGG